MPDFKPIFQKHGLKNTPIRSELLGLFYEVRSSLSVEEIKGKLEGTKDKVTVYRALDAFEKNGLIHRVPDKNNLTRYALCNNKCESENHVHNHSHAHFICNSCNETFCLDDMEVPKVKDINGFVVKSSKLILEGQCPHC